MSAFPEGPPNLKSIQPYLKIAIEHDQRDLIGKKDENVTVSNFMSHRDL